MRAKSNPWTSPDHATKSVSLLQRVLEPSRSQALWVPVACSFWIVPGNNAQRIWQQEEDCPSKMILLPLPLPFLGERNIFCYDVCLCGPLNLRRIKISPESSAVKLSTETRWIRGNINNTNSFRLRGRLSLEYDPEE